MFSLAPGNATAIPFFIYVGAALVVGLVVLFIGRLENDAIGAFTVFLAGLVGWSLTYAGRLLVADLSGMVLLTEVVFLWVSVTAVAWLVFAIRYTGRGAWLTRRTWVAVGGIHLVCLAVVFTNPFHHQFFTDASIVVASGLRTPDLPFGPLAWPIIGVDYSFLLVGGVLLGGWALRSTRMYRWQTFAILVGIAVPTLTTILHVFELHPYPNFDPSPIAFAVSTVPIGLAVVSFRFGTLVPIARATVVQSLADGVVVLDDERVVDANAAARSLLSAATDADECVGRRAGDALPEPFVRVTREGPGADGRECALSLPGERRWYWVRYLPVEEHPHGRVLTFTDVTEQKRRERELERQNERLEEFAGVVSHDLRNPINVVEGQAALLADEVDEGTSRERVASIRDATDRMEEIIEDVLAMAREGRTVEETDPVAVGVVARRAWGHVDTADATLDVVADAGEVRADESRLAQLFENLFRNAVEHGSTGPRQAEDAVEHGSTSPQGTADAAEHDESTVTVTVESLPDRPGFAVADDGPGIEPEHRSDVLEPGFSTTESGTGFGLGIVSQIVDAHGWEMAVTESEDGGARFEFVTAPSTPGSTVEAVGRTD